MSFLTLTFFLGCPNSTEPVLEADRAFDAGAPVQNAEEHDAGQPSQGSAADAGQEEQDLVDAGQEEAPSDQTLDSGIAEAAGGSVDMESVCVELDEPDGGEDRGVGEDEFERVEIQGDQGDGKGGEPGRDAIAAAALVAVVALLAS